MVLGHKKAQKEHSVRKSRKTRKPRKTGSRAVSALEYLPHLLIAVGIMTVIVSIVIMANMPAFSNRWIMFIPMEIGLAFSFLFTAVLMLIKGADRDDFLGCVVAYIFCFSLVSGIAAGAAMTGQHHSEDKAIAQNYVQEHHVKDPSLVKVESLTDEQGDHRTYKITNLEADKTDYIVYDVSPGKIDGQKNISKHTAESLMKKSDKNKD